MAAGKPRNQSPGDAPIASHLVVRVLDWPKVTQGLPRMLVLKNGSQLTGKTREAEPDGCA